MNDKSDVYMNIVAFAGLRSCLDAQKAKPRKKNAIAQLRDVLRGQSAEALLLKMIDLNVRASYCPYHSRDTGFWHGSSLGSCESRGKSCSGHGHFGEYCRERDFLGPPESESVLEYARLHGCSDVAMCVALDDNPRTALGKWHTILHNRTRRAWLRVIIRGGGDSGDSKASLSQREEPGATLVRWFDEYPGLQRLMGNLITRYYNPATAESI